MTDYRHIDVDRRGPVDVLTLNRPERLNALNREMVGELLAYLEDRQFARETRIIVLRGAGKGFCAGLDLAEDDVADFSIEEGLVIQRRISEIIMRLRRVPQVVVALVHGAASGTGFTLALAADLRVVARSARMNASFIKLGVSGCDMGSSYLLPRLAGASVAADLMLTGRFVGADEAAAIGLASRVVDDDQLDAAGEALVGELLQASPLGLKLTKEGVRMGIDAPSLEAAVALEDRNQMLCTATPAFREAVAAFRARKRK